MSTSSSKPPVARAPARRKAQAPQPSQGVSPVVPPVVPLTPVARKIGETPGNLQARAEAFKRRHGSSK